MRKLHDSLRRSEKEVQHLRAQLEEVVETRSIAVDNDINEDLHTVMKSESSKVLGEFPEGSFGRIFWKQQLDAASRKDRRGMRWDPLMVKWCLYLRHKSSGAYELLRDSGCITLPSQRTLRDYTHYMNAAAGFSFEADSQLGTYNAAKIDSCEEYQKCVVMLIDEMYVKEDLVYDKHTGGLIGFVNVGDINSHLLAFEQSLSSTSTTQQDLATTMMMFMVQGLFTALSFPYVQFPCHKVTGQLLFDPFWEAISRLERLGLKVCGIIGSYGKYCEIPGLKCGGLKNSYKNSCS